MINKVIWWKKEQNREDLLKTIKRNHCYHERWVHYLDAEVNFIIDSNMGFINNESVIYKDNYLYKVFFQVYNADTQENFLFCTKIKIDI